MLNIEKNGHMKRNTHSCLYLEGGGRTRLNLMVDATDNCQLACAYCYYGEKGNRTMDVNKVFKASKNMAALFAGRLDEIRIHYMGGEPLLAWDRILDLNELAKNHFAQLGIPFRWSTTSNLVALDERKAEHMISEGAGIHCSVDGPADIHNCNRPFRNGGGSFDAVAKAIPLALRITPNDTARVTVRPEHAERMPEIAHEILDRGFKAVGLFPSTRSSWDSTAIKKWQIGISSSFDFVGKKYGREKKMLTIISPGAQPSGNEKRFSYCSAGKSLWAIGRDGNLYMCHHMTNDNRLAVINAAMATPAEIRSAIESSGIAPQHDSIHKKCRSCEALRFCHGGCWSDALFTNGSSMVPYEDGCRLRIATAEAIGNKLHLGKRECSACTMVLCGQSCNECSCDAVDS